MMAVQFRLMTEADRVHTAEDRKAFVYVESGVDGVPEHLWAPCFRGDGQRRQKVWPTRIAVSWSRRNDKPWRLHWLSVHVSNRYGSSTSIHLSDCGTVKVLEPKFAFDTAWVIDKIMPHAPEGWQPK